MSELAWAAGFFEAAGHVTSCAGRPRIAVRFRNDVLVRRFHAAVGAGRFFGPYGPYKSSLGKDPYFMWVAEREEAQAVIAQLKPWLSQPTLDRVATIKFEQDRSHENATSTVLVRPGTALS